MPHNSHLNRRSFLKNAGLTALVSAVGPGTALPAYAGGVPSGSDSSVFDFDTPYDRIGTDSVRWDQQIRIFGKENIVAAMGVADMDFKVAPPITKALAERIRHENWGYLDLPKSYTDSVILWNKRRYGLDISTDSIVMTNGVHPGIIAALKIFSPPGSKVLLNTPTYSGFYDDLRYTNTKPEENPLKLLNGKYFIDFEDFERRIGPDTHAFILCNPQNPTGNCWSPEELMRL